MQENVWIIWLVLLVAALVLEGLSMQLFSIWFALAAGVTLIATAFGAPVWIQVPLFIVVTAVSVAATRPLVRKLQGKVKATNADRYLDKTAVVLEEINNLSGTGQIRVEGQIWSARTPEDGTIIAQGETVTTLKIQGNKLLVSRQAQAPEAGQPDQ